MIKLRFDTVEEFQGFCDRISNGIQFQPYVTTGDAIGPVYRTNATSASIPPQGFSGFNVPVTEVRVDLKEKLQDHDNVYISPCPHCGCVVHVLNEKEEKKDEGYSGS